MRAEVKRQNAIRDLRAQKLRLQVVKEMIPGLEDKLSRTISERASLERAITKVESHELAKNHSGLCGITPAEVGVNKLGTDKCERYYGHTGLHSWEGGGVG